MMAGHDDDDGDAMWEELSMVAAGKAGPAPEVMARRRRWERFAARMYAVLVIVTMAVAVPVSGWVWWNRPIPRSVALPAGVEEGKMMWMDDSIPPVRTTSGVALSAEDLQSKNREWIALVRWEDPKDSASTKIYKLRLGESVYIDRLGTLTLLEVNPESISSGGMLGWAYRDNVDFDPGCLNAASVTRARGEKCNICDS